MLKELQRYKEIESNKIKVKVDIQEKVDKKVLKKEDMIMKRKREKERILNNLKKSKMKMEQQFDDTIKNVYNEFKEKQ